MPSDAMLLGARAASRGSNPTEFFMRRLTVATFAPTILAPSAWGLDLEAHKELYRNWGQRR